ncbi:MAG: hypothetical protein RPR91_01865, partial [Colwellia sp.]
DKKTIIILDKPVYNEDIESYIVGVYGRLYSDSDWVDYVKSFIQRYTDNGYSVYMKLHPFSNKIAESRFEGVEFLNRNQNLRRAFNFKPTVLGWGSKELLYSLSRGCPSYSFVSNAHISDEYLDDERRVSERIVFEGKGIAKVISGCYVGLPVNMSVRFIENFQRTCEVVNG